MGVVSRKRVTAVGAVSAAALVAYWRVVRPWGLRWGATDEEVARAMPGDEWVPTPVYQTTKAITIHARPDDVWPWLAQMGNGRGGLYSYDFLDRLFGFLDGPSAERILPEYQHLEAGDVIPLGAGKPFPVQYVDAPRALVLAGAEGDVRWSWQFGLYEQADGTTRLVSRNRASGGGMMGRVVVPIVVDPPALVMTRAMLLGIRRRVEGDRFVAAETTAEVSSD